MEILLTHTPLELGEIYAEEAVIELQKLGKVHFNRRDRHLSPEELYEITPDAEIIISEWETGIDESYIKKASKLKAFIRCGVEIRNVDFRAAHRAGIIVANTPGLNVYATVEFTIGMLINLSKNIPYYVSELKKRNIVQRVLTPELYGKTLSVIGMGFIGKRVANAAASLGMKVLGYDPCVRAAENAHMVSFEEALSKADFLTIHAKWTKETEKMIGKKQLSMMKRGTYIINTARGALIDEEALYEALNEGYIKGAALDVFANEHELGGSRFIGHPKVMATPHMAGYSPEMVKRQAMETVKIVRELKNGKTPESIIDLNQTTV